VTEILDVRSRAGKPHVANPIGQVGHLKYLLDHPDAKEFVAYFPVVGVACIEVQIRGAIAQMVDEGSAYAKNAKELVKDQKFDFEVLNALEGREITLGELLAHVVPINHLQDCDRVMSAVVGASYLEGLKHTRDRWAVEIEGKPDLPMIADPSQVFTDIDELFTIRHRCAHEVPRGASEFLDISTARRLIGSLVLFCDATFAFVHELLFPGAPLRQIDMTIYAGKKASVAQAEVMELYQKALSLASEEGRAFLVASQDAWLKFQSETAALHGSRYAGGSMRPMIEYQAAADLARKRVDELREWCEIIEAGY
jgi:uncharacterized protein YecT (DUF1311 family)